MHLAAISAAAAAIFAGDCLLPTYEEYRERRIGVQHPVPAAPSDGTAPEVIYVPQGPTNFYVDYYDPAPYYYVPSYVTYFAPPAGSYYPSYYTPNPYLTPVPRADPRGARGSQGGLYSGYYGGALAPGGYAGSGSPGAGSRYYPGSGASTQPGQSRESYGIYGSGNTR